MHYIELCMNTGAIATTHMRKGFFSPLGGNKPIKDIQASLWYNRAHCI